MIECFATHVPIKNFVDFSFLAFLDFPMAPRVLVLRAPGTNCDLETSHAFELAGAIPSSIHIRELRSNTVLAKDFQILVIPGGFSYGDDAGAGTLFAHQLGHFLGDTLCEFRDQGKLILGICNGFQVLLKSGLLLPHDEDGPVATLTTNTCGRYLDTWVHLRAFPHNCPFVGALDRIMLPVAHGEGRFLVRESWIREGIDRSGQGVLRFCPSTENPGQTDYNPNGSDLNIAGLCDPTGQVFGLMPHPERHIYPTQNPTWTRQENADSADGLQIFRNAVAWFV